MRNEIYKNRFTKIDIWVMRNEIYFPEHRSEVGWDLLVQSIVFGWVESIPPNKPARFQDFKISRFQDLDG